MNKVEKIKAEVERRYNILKNIVSPKNKDYYDGKIEAYLEMLDLLISQLGPVSNDLEEAAHSYVDTTIEWFDSEGNPCCYPAFIAGAQWQKKQMIDKACDWLSNVSIEDMTYKYNNFDTSEDWYKFIEDFKKAMEE